MRNNDFDKRFNSTFRLVKFWIIFSAVLSIALLVGAVWAIYKVMQHFGII